MPIDPRAPQPVDVDARQAANIAELKRRVTALERAGRRTAWKPLASTLVNGWAAGNAAGERPFSYWLDNDGVVHMGGVLVTPAGPPAPNTLVANLPAEVVPAVYTAGLAGYGSTGFNARFIVNAAGELRTDPSTGQTAGSRLNLDGQAYRII